MNSIVLNLERLKSPEWPVRFKACHELKDTPFLPDEAINALQEAINDPNPSVARAASSALKSHYQVDAPLYLPTEKITQEISQLIMSEQELLQQDEILQMNNGIQTWAKINFGLGVISVFSYFNLDPVWGFVMIIVAILAWMNRIPATYILFSVVMGWAALTNGMAVISGLEIWWFFIALLQVYWTFALVQHFRDYRNLPLIDVFKAGKWPKDLPPPQNEAAIANRFAIASLIMAVLVVFLSPTFCLGYSIYSGLSQTEPAEKIISIFISGSVDIAILALGLGCAALFTKNDRKNFAIGGVALSALVLVGNLGMAVIGLLG